MASSAFTYESVCDVLRYTSTRELSVILSVRLAQNHCYTISPTPHLTLLNTKCLCRSSIEQTQTAWFCLQIARYEAERTQNQSTYWVNFELLWRDYFRFVALQHGTLMFQIGGIQRKAQSWRNSPLEFEVSLQIKLTSNFRDRL